MAKAARQKLETKLRALALVYPGVREDHPWGESAFKVKEKVFLFMHAGEDRLSFSVKLPHTGPAALSLPFTAPTGYGLGKSGWVSGRIETGREVPFEVLSAWIDESFRAVAPKTVIKAMDEESAS